MAKKEPDKKALKAIDKAVKKAMKHGVSGGLVDQTVAASIHAAEVKTARKAAVSKKEVVKAEKAASSKKISKADKQEGKDDAGD
jgi:hypothetical protein